VSYLRVTNWRHYQHYGYRNPPWVKLYTELLEPTNKINDLPVPTRYLFDRLLLLAAKYSETIPKDSEWIASVLRMDHELVAKGIEELLKGRWLRETATKRRASKPLAHLDESC
jgi:hypothetical protein